ncbi:MAG: hypothetical protein LBH58_13845 [Tannerellaceae bacterium]|jgi:hypothetical protein|nr:hypothetical protein [Tannerellaceae bacterium]
MAKRRILKKNIGYIAADLTTEVLVCKMLLPDVNHDEMDNLLINIFKMQEEFVRRAHYPDGKDNKLLVKKYYKKLFIDLETEVNTIVKEIEELRKDKQA